MKTSFQRNNTLTSSKEKTPGRKTRRLLVYWAHQPLILIKSG